MQDANDAEALASVMPADQVPLFQAARDAVLALAASRGEDPLSTLWWIFAAPMRMTKSTYRSFYGTKEVWTVNLEHPMHADRPRGRSGR